MPEHLIPQKYRSGWQETIEKLSKHDKVCPDCGQMAIATVDGDIVCYRCMKSVGSFNPSEAVAKLESTISKP